MIRFHPLLAAPALLLAFAGGAQALEITYDKDTSLRMPLKPVSEAQRNADLALGNCLKRHGGRMESCTAQRDQSERIARIDREMAPAAPPAVAPSDATPVVERGPVVMEGPVSSMPPK